ncbi:MAG TPA: ATP-binding cassette domain-containing protein [Methanoculleus sp.]|nr:ATP-binding cassette domain-containing protein [Methanoculleus sp.]
MESVLELREVHFAYPTMPAALKGISLRIRRGSKVALVGPNGAGKTTLLLMCNGTLRPGCGEVLLNGSPVRYDARSLRRLRKTVGLVFQNSDMQVFAPTVYQDVAFGPLNLGIEGEQLNTVVQHALHDVGLAGYEKRPPHHLSGGEKKRVAIAGILAMDPEVLVFDEPTASLDPAGAEEILDLLDELNLAGTTILLSTHDVELAYRWADEVVFMHEGTILASGLPGEVFADEALLQRARLKPPMIVDLHCQLVRRGVIGATAIPSGMLSLIDVLEQHLDGSGTRRRGRILLCDADAFHDGGIAGIAASYGITCIGAMGSKAKRSARRQGLEPEISYGVIDRCILRALAGETPLILTSGGMIDHTMRRIQTYREESGITITVERIEAPTSGS